MQMDELQYAYHYKTRMKNVDFSSSEAESLPRGVQEYRERLLAAPQRAAMKRLLDAT